MPDTREQLLDATGVVLARGGYAGLTTQRVADEVGVSHAAVHYHFDTKADLVAAFAERTHEQLAAALEESGDEPPGERLATVLAGLVDTLDDRDDAEGVAFTRALLVLHGRAPHDDRLRAALADLDRDVTDRVADIVRDGVDDGTFAAVDPSRTALLLLCALDGAALRADTLGADLAGDVAGALVEHVLADLYRGEPPALVDEREDER